MQKIQQTDIDELNDMAITDKKKQELGVSHPMSTAPGGTRKRWRYPKFGTVDGTLKAEIQKLRETYRGEMTMSDLFKWMSALAMHRQTIETVNVVRRVEKLEQESTRGVR